MDTDKSGEVTVDEVCTFMRRKDPSVTEEEILCRFDFLNKDGSGGVSAEEFEHRLVLLKPPPAVELHGWYEEVWNYTDGMHSQIEMFIMNR